MARRTARKKVSLVGFSSIVDEVMALPRSFAFGLLAGLLVPAAALAGIVGGIYLFTKKVPFVTEIVEEGDDRHLIVKLVDPDEARGLFQKGREAAEAFGEEIRVELEEAGARSGPE